MRNMNDQYMNESANEDNSNDDVEDIDPGDKLVNYFNNGSNYNDDDDNDNEEYDDDNDWPQLQRAPIVKVLYKQANIGFAAEAGFFWGGERGRFAQKKGVTLLPRAITDFWEKKFSASFIRIVSYCKYDMYFKKYNMYSIVGIDKKTYGEGIGITYIYT